MNASPINVPLIKLLVQKDWQLFERQLAAHVAGGIVALALIGMAKSWSFYLGSLLLIVILVSVSCFSISNSLVNERKEKTLAFVMSLPVSPLDFYLSKLVGNLITFLVPMLLLLVGSLALIMSIPQLPNGLIVLTVLLFGFVFFAYSVSLCVSMAVESEGWNIFAMIGSNLMINPFLMWIGQIPEIANHTKSAHAVWSAPALGILSAQLILGMAFLVLAGWIHCRKRTFY